MAHTRHPAFLQWHLWFVGLGTLTLWCWWQIHRLGDVRLRLGAFFGWFALAWSAYLAALWLIRRAGTARLAAPLWVLCVVAVAARGLLLTTTPTLSNDIYRYRWDGRVQLAGLDPYAHPPTDPAVVFLRDEDFSQINFPHLRTIYPPLTELAFRLGAWLGPTLTAQKAVFVAAELVTVAALLVILIRRKLSPLWIVAYAWHPLVILEVAGSGHNDALGIAGLWLGLAAWESRRRLGAALAWGAAFLSKFVSIILLPWWGFRRQARRGLAVFLLVAALPFAVHPSAVSAILETLFAVSGRVESNASVFWVLLAVTGHPAAARFIAVGILAAFLFWWGWREADPIRYLFGGLLVMTVLSPVLHPWYVLWLVPFCCFWRVPAVLALTGLVVAAYTVWPGYLADGTWRVPLWARLIEYVPVGCLGIWELRRCAWRSSFRLGTKPRLCPKS